MTIGTNWADIWKPVWGEIWQGGTGGTGTGATAAQIWGYVLSNGMTAAATLVAIHAAIASASGIDANVISIKGQTIAGAGSGADPWRPA